MIIHIKNMFNKFKQLIFKFFTKNAIKINDLTVASENSAPAAVKVQFEKIVISILDDEQHILDNWKKTLGEKDVFYFLSPDDFIMAYNDNAEVKQTTLIITDYYFGHTPVVKLIDEVMLKQVLGFQGKIFLFSNVMFTGDARLNFDYVFPTKTKYSTKDELIALMKEVF